MKRIGYSSLACLAALVFAGSIASSAFATPSPVGAVVKERIFNDCPISVLTSVNNYPASISITDAWNDLCVGYANRHNWRFSTDGTTAALFGNDNNFKFTTTLTLTGPGTVEGGIDIAPWWSPDVGGRFQARIPDGEIACFDGRLPFYSFTGAHGLHYVAGTQITLEVEYHANGLSAISPATIEYRVVYNGNPYTSGPIAFDEGNPAEGHGSWGMLTPAYVGGHVQTNNGFAGTGRVYNATWENTNFTCYDCATPTQNSTWGRLKALYR